MREGGGGGGGGGGGEGGGGETLVNTYLIHNTPNLCGRYVMSHGTSLVAAIMS